MTPQRAIFVSRDRDLRVVVERALAASGLAVEHRDQLSDDLGDVAVVIIDRATREAASGGLGRLAAPVVIVGDDLDDDGAVEAMLEAPVSHLVADPNDCDLGITSGKLASGDLFGLEKYLQRGAPVGERVIASGEDKRHTIGEVSAWAEAIGGRRAIVHRIANVVDELMMNALDASAGSGAHRAVVRWGADERWIAVSVCDELGTLRQRDVIDHVRRARSERGWPRSPTAAQRGAGLGLYLVLANVTSLVINLEPGRRTEVVGLFERARAQRAVSGARSLHVFQAAPT